MWIGPVMDCCRILILPVLIVELPPPLPPSSHTLLSKQFVQQYAAEQPPFGFNGLGELVYRRTYSRMKPDGRTREQWFETVERVVNGAFSMQKEWLLRNQLEWDAEAMQQTAQEMYRRIFAMKFLPPGRGLWAMGSALTEERCVLRVRVRLWGTVHVLWRSIRSSIHPTAASLS